MLHILGKLLHKACAAICYNTYTYTISEHEDNNKFSKLLCQLFVVIWTLLTQQSYYCQMYCLNVYSNSWASAANDMTLTTKHDNLELDLWLVGLARVDLWVYARVGTTAWTLHLRVHKTQTSIINFTPLQEWMWRNCLYHVRHSWNVRTCLSLQGKRCNLSVVVMSILKVG